MDQLAMTTSFTILLSRFSLVFRGEEELPRVRIMRMTRESSVWFLVTRGTDGDGRTPRPIEHTVYPYPNLVLPNPTLTLDFRMSLNLGDRIPVGSSPLGRQTWISFTGGSWSGSWGTGIALVNYSPHSMDAHLLTINSQEDKTVRLPPRTVQPG